MPVAVKMIDGQTFMVEVMDLGRCRGANEGARGEFASGWVIAKGGTHLNLDNAVSLRAYG